MPKYQYEYPDVGENWRVHGPVGLEFPHELYTEFNEEHKEIFKNLCLDMVERYKKMGVKVYGLDSRGNMHNKYVIKHPKYDNVWLYMHDWTVYAYARRTALAVKENDAY